MSRKRIALTTGDADGIGLEVTAKALHHLGPQSNTQFILWRSEGAPDKYLRLIDKKFDRIVVDSLRDALEITGPYLVDIASEEAPAYWVESTAKACLKKDLQAMATAPLSKTSIKEAGYKDLGHTDILKRVSRSRHVHMGFLGNKFNVVLTTAHIPVRDISKHLGFSTLAEALLNANELRKKLPAAQMKKPIGILGLNPHAGEQGLIGQEELLFFPELLEFAKEKKIPVEGPLVPDAAFFPANWGRYSVYLCLYHDQGLIPFKMIHGQDSGVHMTLGIPFIRTSVDHGTAKDIFGQNKANPNSMIDAVRWAVKLARL
ncbi:4-hydroxythreonine-4-phosphate dehydrogenase PdxA [Bdellovibrio bacteriovorus]|uniref:4-hydroxythreonine-4-phosphate dehydrogenase PdxA n=1 Tax=Bdellovibrio bacteriovorus TaxID=959 RepID=UPI0021D3A462|nr:4-hydroxythreonine-4-phosphate dehydrogenase PdxA [Bdellovibrio bacteriovorus]UXR65725.1 4-hydroxythreonine-4-phosphate dehydrogenase PdxA [Bdellovibrio bacteriovorus]